MTEKRFTLENELDDVYTFNDYKKGTTCSISINEGYVEVLMDIVDKLNELHEKNQDNEAMIEFLSTENTQIWNELKTRTQIQHQLEKENEQLKKYIEEHSIDERLLDDLYFNQVEGI